MLSRLLHAAAVAYEGLVNLLALTTSDKANQFRDEIFAQLDAQENADHERVPFPQTTYRGIDAYSMAIVRLSYKRPTIIFLYFGIWIYWLILVARVVTSLLHR